LKVSGGRLDAEQQLNGMRIRIHHWTQPPRISPFMGIRERVLYRRALRFEVKAILTMIQMTLEMLELTHEEAKEFVLHHVENELT
jgi:hypothetical protein